MGVTSSDWQVPSLATAGTAPDGTQMAAVELLVSDLDAMTRFYQEAVTLDVLNQSGASATLGRPGTPIVTLRQEKDLPGPDRHGAGLYHTAILFKDESALASAVASVAQRAPGVFEGSADHHVSEAFYFHDPEGNGLELYRDRPREEWSIRPDGTIVMGVDPLDPNAYLLRWHDPDASAPEGAIGHVHLQVGNIEAARRFYVDVLGFDITAQIGTALFVSAGGYHHHIGVNTWNSAGAGPRAASLGLGDVRIIVPARSDIDALTDRLRFHSIPAADDGHSLRFEDPWGTRLAVTPAT
ncbi:catechol 2,3-dioxygenase [Leucobacter luti]|uniref:Catechol 2,3-dioxygenase n=1 Tax=Leucobacter luti TaxID=340320 RepID=A0A4R6RVQ7_9MICO|nr:VOC family protein [Leucobacter luti]TDP90405.1 catechol 2,3-dioxygenase [Leucobacter luti]